MGYQLERSETPQQGLRRIVLEQINDARATLADPDNPHTAIHDARKCFKKIRAALRLARKPLDDVYADENACFRDLGRELSQLRDADAVIETVDRLAEKFARQVQPHVFDAARRQLVSRRDAIADTQTDLTDLTEKLHAVAAALDNAARRVENWPALPDDFSAFSAGLKKTYRRGAEGMQTALDKPSAENYHEWRKRVKYLWYHVRLLQDSWPTMMKALRTSLKSLSRTLGHDHDLAVLSQTISDQPTAFGSEQDTAALLALIKRRQKQLRKQADPVGLHIYAEDPGDFVDRIEAYWHAWRESD